MIPYGRHYISDDDIEAVLKVMKSDFLTQGPQITEFEKYFADYTGAMYAVAVSNGTAALHLCAMALGVGKNSRVITTPITFAASANCILYCGGKVEFCDIDPFTGVIDINKLEAKLSTKPKGYYAGIIPVDFAGFPANLEKIRKLADLYDCWIIEDACHAPGGYFTDSKKIQQRCGNGAYADLAIFSFHPVKHIATGEGGMITTNDRELYEKLLVLRTHGITKDADKMTQNDGGWYYQMTSLGYNYRMPDMLCALGIAQLKRADEGIVRRINIAKKYDEAFRTSTNITVLTPNGTADLQNNGILHAHHLYVIQVQDRKGLYDYLRENNIYTQVHYIPVHTMPYYRANGFANTQLPLAEAYYQKCLSLPMYPSMKDEEQEYVIEKVITYCG
jgi:UDP-4-amino-4,6-dideoxy-N-acetyl-beta-L-altrosamine transaminase